MNLLIKILKRLLRKISPIFPRPMLLGSCGKNSRIQMPCYVSSPCAIHLDENVIIRRGSTILNNRDENIYVKKYTVLSTNCTIITNSHKSTVGIPHILLGASHINDISSNLTIGEDVFIGANVTILPKSDIGRGCVIGACSTVTKPLPPYALAVGSPAKIIGAKFTVEQILKHEEVLYPPEERMSKNEILDLFKKYYSGFKTYGVETLFSEDDKIKFNRAREIRKFIDPRHKPIIL